MGHFQSGDITNKVAMNIHMKSMYGSLLFFLLSKYLGFGWSHHMVCVYELLQKPLNHFPKWLYHFTFPHLCVRPSPFIFSSTLDMLGLLIISLMTNDDEHRFMCFYTLCYISMAAIINYHKLVGLKQQKVLLSQFWRLNIWNQFYKIKIKVLAEILGENTVSCPFQHLELNSMNSLAHGPLLHLQSHGTASSLSDSASLRFCHMAFFSSVVKAISFPLVWHTWLNLRPTQIIQDNLPISRILIDSHLQSPFFSPTKVTLTWFPGGSVVMNPPANAGDRDRKSVV